MLNIPCKKILSFLVVFMCFIYTATSQALCTNPIIVGELRVLKSRLCVDIEKYSGRGNVQTWYCDSEDDQQLIMCGDGTIRNMKSNSCFSPEENGNVVSTTCRLFPEIPNYQKWRFGDSKIFMDEAGILQEAKEIINVKSGKCLDIPFWLGLGNVYLGDCTKEDDQFFFFRFKGRLIAHGRLQVQKSGLCLDVAKRGGGARLKDNNVGIYTCENFADQHFKFYENGELINDKSRLCVDVAGYEGTGNIAMYYCRGFSDQMWLQPRQYCDGDYCSFVNKASNECLDVENYEASSGSNVATYQCEGLADQRFKWVSGHWVPPTAEWDLVACNQNGQVTHEISNEVSYSSTISTTVSVEVTAAIEAETLFGSVSLSTTVSSSLSKQFETSHSSTKTITLTCENYDSGEPFVRGCMWQLAVTTKKTLDENELRWKPQIVKCSQSNVSPMCPPFTRCMDKECTRCEEFPSSRSSLARRFLQSDNKQ